MVELIENRRVHTARRDSVAAAINGAIISFLPICLPNVTFRRRLGAQYRTVLYRASLTLMPK